MSGRRTTYGFGVDPVQSQNHFFVVIPAKGSQEKIQVFERFAWTPPAEPNVDTEQKSVPNDQTYADGQVLERSDILRLEISRYKWSMIANDLAAEFNARLKANKETLGRFSIDGTPVERLFGKEMMILLWSIEDCDPSNVPTAIRNWKGLMPEERWWLYTMTNASTGHMKDKKGWRVALRYALCENPIEEHPQLSLFENLDEEDTHR